VAGEQIKKKFGRRIRELRIGKGITSQVALAAKSGIDRSYIGGVERGQRNIALVNIEKIAKALDLPITVLFEFDSGTVYSPANKKIWIINDK